MGYDRDKIGRLDREIHTPDYEPPEIDDRLDRDEVAVPEDWSDDRRKQAQSSGVKRNAKPLRKVGWVRVVFLTSLLFMVSAIAYATYVVLGGGSGPSPDNVVLQVNGPIATGGGERLSYQLFIANKNATDLNDVRILVEYPSGAASVDTGESVVRDTIAVGTVPAGGVVNEVRDVVLYGEADSKKDIFVALEYRFAGMNQKTTLRKETVYTVNLVSSPIRVDMRVLREVTSGEIFPIEMSVASEAEESIEGILLSVKYPAGFHLVDASVPPTYGNRVWDLGDLGAHEEKKITLRGYIEGHENENLSLQMTAGTRSATGGSTIGVVYGSRKETLRITQPFIDARLAVTQQTKAQDLEAGDAVIDGKVPFRGVLTLTNNLPSRVIDVRSVLHMEGNVLDPESFTGDALFDIKKQEAVWSQRTTPELASLEPGETVSLPFTMKPSDPLSASGVLTRDPFIAFNVVTEGKRFDDVNVPQRVTMTPRGVVRVETEVQVSTALLHRTGPIVNSGPFPPVAGKKTTFTVVMSVSNKSSDLENVTARTTLPPGVEYTGVVFPKGEDVQYDPDTGELTWLAGDVEAGAGFIRPARTVAVQLEYFHNPARNIPNPTIMKKTIFEADSVYTGAHLTFTAGKLNIGSLRD